MALIVLTNGHCTAMDADKAANLWSVFNGDKKGTEEQIKFASKVARIYLNKRNCPESYTKKYAVNGNGTKELWYKQGSME